MIRILILLSVIFIVGNTYAGHPNAAIYHAALNGDLCGIARAISSGGTVNQQYPFTKGRTPLMAAIISGDWKTVNFLLRFGSDVRRKNNDKSSKEHGWDALQYAEKYREKDKASKKEKEVGITILNLIKNHTEK